MTSSDNPSGKDRTGPTGPGGRATIDISRSLRAYYDSVRDEAIPDRLLDLLEQLDQVERSAKDGDRP